MSADWMSQADRAEEANDVRAFTDWWLEHAATGCNDPIRCPHLREQVEELVRGHDERSGVALARELRRLQWIYGTS